MDKFSDILLEIKDNVLRFVKRNKSLIGIISIALICSIAIAIGIYAQITNKKIVEDKQSVDEETYQQLKQNFNNLFDNEGNEYVSIKYDIEEDENGEYSVDVNIPIIDLETDATKKINKDINSLFVEKLRQIANRNGKIYNL